MKDKLFANSYKIIPLYAIEPEEFEMENDNISELLVLHGATDISKSCKVVLNLSKDALIGFSHQSIRLADSFPKNCHIHIDPLGTSLSSQSMGFFLTPSSSELIVYCENQGTLIDYGVDKVNCAFSSKKNFNTLNLKYLIDMEFDSDFVESYNIGFNNVAEMKVLKDGEDITSKCTVTLKLSKNALLGLGTQLIRLAHNFDRSNNLFIKPINDGELSCSTGFFLTPNSASFVVGCKNFENVFYYDKDFGRW